MTDDVLGGSLAIPRNIATILENKYGRDYHVLDCTEVHADLHKLVLLVPGAIELVEVRGSSYGRYVYQVYHYPLELLSSQSKELWG